MTGASSRLRSRNENSSSSSTGADLGAFDPAEDLAFGFAPPAAAPADDTELSSPDGAPFPAATATPPTTITFLQAGQRTFLPFSESGTLKAFPHSQVIRTGMACSHPKADPGRRFVLETPLHSAGIRRKKCRRTNRSTTVNRVTLGDAKSVGHESATVRIRDLQDKAPDASVNAGESGKSGLGG